MEKFVHYCIWVMTVAWFWPTYDAVTFDVDYCRHKTITLEHQLGNGNIWQAEAKKWFWALEDYDMIHWINEYTHWIYVMNLMKLHKNLRISFWKNCTNGPVFQFFKKIIWMKKVCSVEDYNPAKTKTLIERYQYYEKIVYFAMSADKMSCLLFFFLHFF